MQVVPGDPDRLRAGRARARTRRRRARPSRGSSGRGRTAGRSTRARRPAAGRGRSATRARTASSRSRRPSTSHGLGVPSGRPAEQQDGVEDLGERVRVDGEHLGAAAEVRQRGVDRGHVDRADGAEVLGDDQVGVEVARARPPPGGTGPRRGRPPRRRTRRSRRARAPRASPTSRRSCEYAPRPGCRTRRSPRRRRRRHRWRTGSPSSRGAGTRSALADSATSVSRPQAPVAVRLPAVRAVVAAHRRSSTSLPVSPSRTSSPPWPYARRKGRCPRSAQTSLPVGERDAVVAAARAHVASTAADHDGSAAGLTGHDDSRSTTPSVEVGERVGALAPRAVELEVPRPQVRRARRSVGIRPRGGEVDRAVARAAAVGTHWRATSRSTRRRRHRRRRSRRSRAVDGEPPDTP